MGEPIKPKTYCYTGDNAFVPEQMGNVLDHMNANLDVALKHFQKSHVKGPLDRMMYHLFNGQFNWKTFNCNRLFNTATVVGALYNKSFSTGHGRNKVPYSESSEQFFALHPKLKKVLDSTDGRPC